MERRAATRLGPQAAAGCLSGAGDHLPQVITALNPPPTTMHDDEPAREYPPIQTRTDGATGWSAALPLLLVGLLTLMLLHSCFRG